MLELAGDSILSVQNAANVARGIEAKLVQGTLVFSAAQAAWLNIIVCDASIRPVADARTVAQVSVAGPKELRIYARRGALEFSYHGETETIPEEKAYRVVLDPPDEESDKKEPVKGRKAKAFLVLIAGGGLPALIFGLHEAFESPERP